VDHGQKRTLPALICLTSLASGVDRSHQGLFSLYLLRYIKQHIDAPNMDGTMTTNSEHSSKVEGSGRKKGTPNKTSGLMKNSIILAAELAGQDLVEEMYGENAENADPRFVEQARKDGMTAYLRIQAKANPQSFMTLMGKVLPMQVNAEVSGAKKVVVEWGE